MVAWLLRPTCLCRLRRDAVLRDCDSSRRAHVVSILSFSPAWGSIACGFYMVILFAIKCEESRADSNWAKRAERMTQSSSRFQLLSFSLMSVSLGKLLRLMVAGLTDLRILLITVFIFLLAVSVKCTVLPRGCEGVRLPRASPKRGCSLVLYYVKGRAKP